MTSFFENIDISKREDIMRAAGRAHIVEWHRNMHPILNMLKEKRRIEMNLDKFLLEFDKLSLKAQKNITRQLQARIRQREAFNKLSNDKQGELVMKEDK